MVKKSAVKLEREKLPFLAKQLLVSSLVEKRLAKIIWREEDFLRCESHIVRPFWFII